MDRRSALKNIGLSLGYITATPAVLSILQSCQKKQEVIWIPKFFTKEEGIVIQKLTDLIIPESSSSPGAMKLNIPQFLDLYFEEVESEIKQNYFKKGIQLILKQLGGNISNVSINEYDKLLTKFLRANKQEIGDFKKDKENNKILGVLLKLRELTIWAFLTSEKIGEEVLAYDPIPGIEIGCLTVQDATGGKKWSL
jgi:hypothetical protein